MDKPVLRVYTKHIIGDKEIENEVEINDSILDSKRMEIIKLMLGIEDE